MLTKISFSYFTLAGLVALVQKIVNLLKTKLPEDQMVATFITRIEPKLATALQAIGSSTKQPLTEKITLADLRRDNSYRSLRDHIRAGLRRENDTYREACEALWPIFEKNGLKLYNIAREKETAGIDSLLNDAEKPEYEAHIKTTKTTAWFTELDTDNQTFVAATQERSAVRSTDDTQHDSTAFKGLKISLDLLENMLNTLLAMNMPEGIAEVVAEVSQYISEANTSAKISKSKRSNDNDDETTPPDED